MNYTEIIQAGINYSDRKDADTASNLDMFLRVTESRINRYLKTQKMTSRSTLPTITGQKYYGLPDDFNGLRDIQINSVNSNGQESNITMHYLSPEQMNDKSFDAQYVTNPAGTSRNLYYAIIADQLQIHPAQENNEIEIVYYRKLPELTAASVTNWLSDENPDAYIFGLLVEISSYAKDAEAKGEWDSRFKESLIAIVEDDEKSRWSGTQLQVRA